MSEKRERAISRYERSANDKILIIAIAKFTILYVISRAKFIISR